MLLSLDINVTNSHKTVDIFESLYFMSCFLNKSLKGHTHRNTINESNILHKQNAHHYDSASILDYGYTCRLVITYIH